MNAGVEVEDFAYLASAVAGRPVVIRLNENPATLACCDGQTILLPRCATPSQPDAWLEVVAQALLLAAGSLSTPRLHRLVGRPQAARRYAYLEVRRALRLNESRIPHAFARHPLLNTPLPDEQAATATAEDSIAYALAGHRPLPVIPDFVGYVRPLSTLRMRLTQEGIAALSGKQQTGKLECNEDAQADSSDDAPTERSRLLELLNAPMMTHNPLSELLNKIFGATTSPGNQPHDGGADGAEMPVGQTKRAWRRGIKALKAALAMAPSNTDGNAISSRYAYPEWDESRGTYQRDWVLIDEGDPWRPEGPNDLDAILSSAPRELKRQLSALGLDYEMHRRQPEGAEFDVGRLIECAIDLKLGHTSGAVDIYRASKKTRRDLGVMVVVDISGSTEEKNDRGESVFEHHLRAAWQLAQTFDRLGDRVALYGFQSWGRKQVRMLRLKGHEENWSGRVAERLRLLEPLGYTRTGAAIRHADRMLRTSMRLPNRLLILITDGFPYDQGYEEKYAEADTRMALAEARAQGTACVCLCVGGSAGAARLATLYGAANLLMVDDAAQIAGRIRSVCMQALQSVSKRKLKPAPGNRGTRSPSCQSSA